MIVCNHIGFLELFALVNSPMHPCFTPRKSFESNLLLGPLVKGLQSLFVDRGGTLEEREKILEAICERQAKIADEKLPYAPVNLFAEGGTTNGRALQKFKRGAFTAMRPVTPCFIKFGKALVTPCYDIIELLPLFFLMLSNFSMYTSKLYIMPDFHPNQYMLDNCTKFVPPTKPGVPVEPWEVYAWCVRDAMSQASGMPCTDIKMADKVAYEKFMQMKSKQMTYEGRTWTAKKGKIVCESFDNVSMNTNKEHTKPLLVN